MLLQSTKTQTLKKFHTTNDQHDGFLRHCACICLHHQSSCRSAISNISWARALSSVGLESRPHKFYYRSVRRGKGSKKRRFTGGASPPLQIKAVNPTTRAAALGGVDPFHNRRHARGRDCLAEAPPSQGSCPHHLWWPPFWIWDPDQRCLAVVMQDSFAACARISVAPRWWRAAAARKAWGSRQRRCGDFVGLERSGRRDRGKRKGNEEESGER